GKLVLPRVHKGFAALVDHALDVGDDDVFGVGAKRQQKVEARQGCGTGACGCEIARVSRPRFG
ncbi:MAG: hypothetical protein AAFW98_18805, partial [Pseudomonadota bacterium]